MLPGSSKGGERLRNYELYFLIIMYFHGTTLPVRLHKMNALLSSILVKELPKESSFYQRSLYGAASVLSDSKWASAHFDKTVPIGPQGTDNACFKAH